ncbi:MAG: STAS/SEC14 domain-containing protein [Gammaproteobacteria bacterium]|nr:STAS/SEC14 domain-containing protein [Gammaproteobacteria bacterium]
MPAYHCIDREARIVFTVWRGEAIDVDFIDALKKYHQDIKNKTELVEYNELVDLSKITGIKLTIEGIKKLGEIAVRTDQNKIKTKLAFVVSSDMAFGLARMYEAYRSLSRNANKEIRVFKKENDALVWIKNNT